MLLRRVLVFLMLMLIWVVLSGKLDGTHLLMGVISCVIVTWISGDLVFTKNVSVGELAKQACRFVGYVIWLMWELMIANFHVFRLAMSPKGLDEVQPRIVTFQTKLKGDFSRFLLANSITLTPGTITIELEGDKLFIHAISEATAKEVGRPMEVRIAKIFGETL